MNTDCEHCLFAIKQDGKQIGCRLNRLDKFKRFGQAKLEQTGSYLINNYCNTCRNVYWNEYCYENHTIEELVKIAREEEKVKFDAIIDIEHSTKEKLSKIVKKLHTNKYRPYLNKIVFFGKMTEENIEMTKELCSQKHILAHLNESDDKFTQSSHHVHKTIAHYLAFIQPGITFNFDMSTFEKAMNEDLVPIIYSNSDKQFIVSTYFYKNHIQYDNPIRTIIAEYDEYGKSKSEHTDS